MKSNSKKQLLSSRHSSHSLEPPPTATPNSQTSKCLPKYMQVMRGAPSLHLLTNKQHLLTPHRIYYNRNNFQPQLNITIIYKSKNCQIVNFAVSFSYFMFEISSLNIIENSRIRHSNMRVLGRGSYGRVYGCEIGRQQPFAIKSIAYRSMSYSDQNQHKSEVIRKTLKNTLFEYCLYKLFSILQIGPRVVNIFGFDIIMYEDSIQFPMQICHRGNFACSSLAQLAPSLQLMHSLHLIHGDIKPNNLMWSPSFGKNVLIDFGLSKMVRESVGQLTRTAYFGTYQYCCGQMKGLFQCEGQGWVDLYYNDVYGLQRVFQEQQKGEKEEAITCINGRKQKQKQKQHKQGGMNYYNLIQNFTLCYMIYEKDYDSIKPYLTNNRSLEIQQITYQMMFQLQPSAKIARICEQFPESQIFTNQFKNSVIEYHQMRKINQAQPKRKRQVVQARFRQLINKFSGSINDLMVFFLIYFSEDVTPNALHQSISTEREIIQGNVGTVQFWCSFIGYCFNVYVDAQKLDDFMKIVLRKLDIRAQSDRLNERVRLIADAVLQKYKINVFQLHRDALMAKMCRKNLLNCELLNSVYMKNEEDFPYQQLSAEINASFDQIQQKLINPELICQIFQDTVHRLCQKHHIDSIPVPVKLIESALKADYMKASTRSRNLNNEIEYLENFAHFQPAQRSLAITLKRNQAIITQKYVINNNEYTNLQKQFMSQTPNIVFDYHAYLQMLACECLSFGDGVDRPVQMRNLFEGIDRMVETGLKFYFYWQNLRSLISILDQGCAVLALKLTWQYQQQLQYHLHKTVLKIISYFDGLVPSPALLTMGMLLCKLRFYEPIKQKIHCLCGQLEEQLDQQNFNTQSLNQLKVLVIMRLSEIYKIFSGQKRYQILSKYVKKTTFVQGKVFAQVKANIYAGFITTSCQLSLPCQIQLRQLLQGTVYQQLEIYAEYLEVLKAISIYYRANISQKSQQFCAVVKNILSSMAPPGSPGQQQNFYHYLGLQCLFFNVLENPNMSWLQMFITEVVDAYKQSLGDINQCTPNVLFIYLLVLKFYMNEESFVSSEPLVMKLLKQVYYCFAGANFFIQRRFTASMHKWYLIIYDKKNSLRKNSHVRQLKSLNFLRKSSYIAQKVNISIQSFLHGPPNCPKLMLHKIQNLWANKLTKIRLPEAANINFEFIPQYLQIVNALDPCQI